MSGIDGIAGRPVRNAVTMATVMICTYRAQLDQKDKKEKLEIEEIE